MSKLFEIDAESRIDAGKGASRRLRRAGKVPGILYGAIDKEPRMIMLSHSDLIQHLEHEAFYSRILDLKIDGVGQQVILKDLQRNPAKPSILHVDFQRVRATEKLRTNVPLHFVGEERAPGVKMGGGVSHHLNDVEVLCLPKDLPEFIDVDISNMEIGDTLMLTSLQLPTGVELTALIQGAEKDMPVVAVHAVHITEEEIEEGAAEEVPDTPEGAGEDDSE